MLNGFKNYISHTRGLADNTVKGYISDLENFFIFLKDKKINNELLNLYLKYLNKKNVSPKSKQRFMSSLLQFVNWHNEYYPNCKIYIDKVDIKSGIYLPDTIQFDEISRLINLFTHDNFIHSRNKTILDFLYSTACRVSEVCTVKTYDIDLDEDFIVVTGKGSKQRIVPIGSQLKLNLLKYIKIRENFVNNKNNNNLFITKNKNPIDRTAIFRIVKNSAIKAGINESIHPHTLRHSAATQMLEAGCDLRTLQEFLGHSSVSTTQIYTKLTKEFLSEVFKESHPRA